MAVVPLGPREAAALRARAADLGIEAPTTEEGVLRRAGGRCVFLTRDNLCLLHDRFGPEAKPQFCRQFPVVAIDTAEGRRIGLDPGCFTSVLSPRADAASSAAHVEAIGRPIPAAQREAESSVLETLSSAATIGGALARLTGDAAGPDGAPPSAFVEQTLQRLRELRAAMVGPGTAPAVRLRLRHVADNLSGPGPGWLLGDESTRFGLMVAHRVVYLRLLPTAPGVAARATLAGAVAAAWADPSLPRFGPALSAWTWVLRQPGVAARWSTEETG